MSINLLLRKSKEICHRTSFAILELRRQLILYNYCTGLLFSCTQKNKNLNRIFRQVLLSSMGGSQLGL